MKIAIRLTDGTTTITLSGTDDIKLMLYNPVISTDFSKPVDDQISIAFVGSPTNNRAKFNSINRLLEQARNYKFTETGPRIYIEVDPDNTGTFYRSLVFNGSLTLTDETIGNPLQTQYVYAVLQVSRDPFWEGELTQIPLTNSSDTDNTDGIDVDNARDDSHENFVDIAAGDVIGDLPASIKVQLEANTSGAAKNKELYIHHNVHSNPASFTHMLEAENATGSTVSAATDANCQNGSKATLSWTSTSETLIATWSISDAQVTYAAGGRFAVLARWKGAFPYTNAWIRVKLLTSNDRVLWSGNLALISSTRELALLDVLRLPPYLAGQSSIKGIKLAMYGYRNQSGTHSIVLDYLQLSPISGEGGWKRFLSVDDGIAYQEKFVHDDTEGFNYRIDSGDKWISEYSAFGGPILLIPNKNQRLYFNECDKDGAASIAQAWKVKLWYRPRRSSL